MGRALSRPEGVHEVASNRLRLQDQRYTVARRRLVDALAGAGRPLSIPEIADVLPGTAQSSLYRNVTYLIDAGVVRRLPSSDDRGRFELAEELSEHHHHLVCEGCGRVEDLVVEDGLERALHGAVLAAASIKGFFVTDHRLDLLGTCRDCAPRS